VLSNKQSFALATLRAGPYAKARNWVPGVVPGRALYIKFCSNTLTVVRGPFHPCLLGKSVPASLWVSRNGRFADDDDDDTHSLTLFERLTLD